MARADELRPRAGSRRAALCLCITGVLSAHLLALDLGREALRDLVRAALVSRAPSAAAAVMTRQLAAASPVADVAAAQAGAEPTSAPAAERSASGSAALVADEPVYIPRALLSSPPVARQPVLLHWPPGWPFKGSYRGVLKLYIDEQGRVQRVQADDDGLPEAMLETARQAFLGVEFTPGELNGRAVRSWVRVEVNFDIDALQRPAER